MTRDLDNFGHPVIQPRIFLDPIPKGRHLPFSLGLVDRILAEVCLGQDLLGLFFGLSSGDVAPCAAPGPASAVARAVPAPEDDLASRIDGTAEP